MRVGLGYDVHKLVEGRDLILGGVTVPHTLGLLGHSDADVLTHAIMDALLGAAALGDIGKHFPDTDPEYKGADSMKLMAHVRELIEEKGRKDAPGRPILYGTTRKFLQYFNIESLDQLPENTMLHLDPAEAESLVADELELLEME